ncbi:MAG: GNAT family N-acetyltransferase [Defluviitaleaceae bacterium]|nr:GNAT family N-acetyltransferase [Defluviitaleaceae bacterium]
MRKGFIVAIGYNQHGITVKFSHNGEEVGTSVTNFLNNGMCYLVYLETFDKHRGTGLGRKCMNNLFHFLKQKGIRRINTDTYTAMGFYEKIGFTSFGLGRSYINAIGDWRIYHYPLSK